MMKFTKGKRIFGESHRFGFCISFEKNGVYFIYQLNHGRYFIGIADIDPKRKLPWVKHWENTFQNHNGKRGGKHG